MSSYVSFLNHVHRETRGVAYAVVVWQLREVTILVSASNACRFPAAAVVSGDVGRQGEEQ